MEKFTILGSNWCQLARDHRQEADVDLEPRDVIGRSFNSHERAGITFHRLPAIGDDLGCSLFKSDAFCRNDSLKRA